MEPAIDKTLIPLILGPITGLLVMKGVIEPAQSSQFVDLAQQVIGGLIALVSIIGWFVHHTALVNKKNTQSTQSVPENTTSSTVPVQ